jgi:hypothetical protein
VTDEEIKRLRALLADVRPGATNANFVAAACVALPKLLHEVERLTLLSDAWRKVLDAVDPEARERAICRTCPSNECQIRERCTSATACRSLYNLAASSRPAP